MSAAFSKDINLQQRGVVGDGVYDNWFLIQSAIDEVINDGGGTIYFPKGEFAIYNKTLIIWGSNVTLKGENAAESIIVKKGKAGYFGDCLGIVGKINSYFYYGSFGLGDYNKRTMYEGETIQSENILVECLGITTDLDGDVLDRANNVGILNAANVVFKKCVISNAPQSNVAVVNDTNIALNQAISFEECQFVNSKQHNVRVSSYNKGTSIGNSVSFYKCSFLNVQSPDIFQREVVGLQLHLWYRGIGTQEQNHVQIEDCVFDDTGFVFCNGINTNMDIRKSEIASYLFVINPLGNDESALTISKTTIDKAGGFKRMLSKVKQENTTLKIDCGYVETRFGIQYPCDDN